MLNNIQTMDGSANINQFICNVPQLYNTAQAQLLLFEPRPMPMQYRRPYVYAFNGHTEDVLKDTISAAKEKPWQVDYTNNIRNIDSLSGAIGTSINAQNVNTNITNNSWTFMLIVDSTVSDSLYNQPGTSPGCTPCRDYYTGIILGEPYAQNFSGGSLLPNPNAYFVVTHYSKLTSNTIIAPTGAVVRNNTQADYDIIAPSTAQNMTNGTLYDGRPQTLTRCLTIGETDSVGPSYSCAVRPVAEGETNSNTALRVNTALNSPNTHMSTLIDAMVQGYVDNTGYASSDNEMSCSTPMDVVQSISAKFRSGNNGISTAILPCDQMISFQELDRKFPTMHTYTVRYKDTNTGLNLEENGGQRDVDVYRSLIAYALPSLMVRYGILSISFSYNSAQQDLEAPAGDPGLMNIQSVGFMYPTPEDTQAFNLRLFKKFFRSDIAFHIRNTRGDFTAYVNCSVTGSCYIQLVLMDQGYIGSGSWIEHNNMFGGLLSPLTTGVASEIGNNASQMYGLIDDNILAPSVKSYQRQYDMPSNVW